MTKFKNLTLPKQKQNINYVKFQQIRNISLPFGSFEALGEEGVEHRHGDGSVDHRCRSKKATIKRRRADR